MATPRVSPIVFMRCAPIRFSCSARIMRMRLVPRWTFATIWLEPIFSSWMLSTIARPTWARLPDLVMGRRRGLWSMAWSPGLRALGSPITILVALMRFWMVIFLLKHGTSLDVLLRVRSSLRISIPRRFCWPTRMCSCATTIRFTRFKPLKQIPWCTTLTSTWYYQTASSARGNRRTHQTPTVDFLQ